MNLTQHGDDTIAAISTPRGQGGIGIVRLSGPDALSIADRLFVSKKTKRPDEEPLCPSRVATHTVHYGYALDFRPDAEGRQEREMIDEVLLTVMRAPHSYTREDVVEISCHGGTVPLQAILRAAIALGARLSEPGEFTKRAFLNGRIDLSQAEAVLDVIRAKTEAFLKVSVNQLKGQLSAELESIREELMAVYTNLEAEINFPEEDINADVGQPGAESPRASIFRALDMVRERVEKLLKTSHHGKVLREGIKIVICGKPNVGKSSLLNVLLKEPRAIVSPVAGTTRDTIEETLQIRGIPVQLVDTAGVLSPRDMIEEEAVQRSRQAIQAADLVLFVLDASRPWSEEDQALWAVVAGLNRIIVFNKSDLSFNLTAEEGRPELQGQGGVKISALTRQGLPELEDKIVERIWQAPDIVTAEIMLTNMRHIQALLRAQAALGHALEYGRTGLSWEFISEDIKSAVRELDRITGRDMDSDLLDKIFSQFCIGK